MAKIFLAIQESLGRSVAIKALKPSIALDSAFAIRFEREAQFMASMQHENILHVYDFIKDQDMMYIIMEYVQGIDLYDLLEPQHPLPIDVACIIALQTARALDYIHFRGIIHRDIKPANIMLSDEGAIKLMDFGIARDETLSDLTETGTGLGTPSYMSPEQIIGNKLDARSDLFSLGIVLYQMLTGQKPFVEDSSKSVLQKIRLDKVLSVRKANPLVSAELERILLKCLEKLPHNRYANAQQLIDDLSNHLLELYQGNPSARLVTYLKDKGFVTQERAYEVLGTATMKDVNGPSDANLQSIWKTALGAGVLLVLVVLSGEWFSNRFKRLELWNKTHSEFVSQATGKIRVVAKPWAHVFVDGNLMFTTPAAEAVPLTLGTHTLSCRNPTLGNIEQEIVVETSEIKRLVCDFGSTP